MWVLRNFVQCCIPKDTTCVADKSAISLSFSIGGFLMLCMVKAKLMKDSLVYLSVSRFKFALLVTQRL